MGDMGCRETRREIERYVDGECLQELTVQVEVHLAGCTDCNDHAEFKRHMKLLIASKCGGEELPEGLAAPSPAPAPPTSGEISAEEALVVTHRASLRRSPGRLILIGSITGIFATSQSQLTYSHMGI